MANYKVTISVYKKKIDSVENLYNVAKNLSFFIKLFHGN